jgi:PAS domain S-box-containing protein
MQLLDEDEPIIQDVFENSHFGAAIAATDGQWVRVNPYLCELLGYPEEELLAMTFQDVTHPEDLLSEQPYLERMIAGGIDHYQFRKRYLHKDGHIVWAVLDRSLVRDSDRAPRYFVSRIRDYTAEKNAEQPPTLLDRVHGWLTGLLHRSYWAGRRAPG